MVFGGWYWLTFNPSRFKALTDGFRTYFAYTRTPRRFLRTVELRNSEIEKQLDEQPELKKPKVFAHIREIYEQQRFSLSFIDKTSSKHFVDVGFQGCGLRSKQHPDLSPCHLEVDIVCVRGCVCSKHIFSTPYCEANFILNHDKPFPAGVSRDSVG